MAKHESDWSELSTDLILSIARLLETRDDLRCFQGVCKNWRVCSSILPYTYHNLPYLSPIYLHNFLSRPMPPYEESIITANSTFLLHPKNTNPDCSSIKPWLITVEDKEFCPGTLLLRQPLTRDIVKDFSKVLNLSDCNVIPIQTGYNLRYGGRYSSRFYFTIWYLSIHKVVLLFDPASVHDCFVLATSYGSRYIYFSKLSDRKHHGHLCGDGDVYCAFDDIVNYKGSVWVIDNSGRVYVIHYSDNLELVRLSTDVVSNWNDTDTQKRLVESCDGLYLIDRTNKYDEPITLRVYKLDEKEFRWNVVMNLGDRILFVLSDYCFFRPAKEFPGCGRNCIFFHTNHFKVTYDCPSNDTMGLEVGVFHLDDGESGLLSSYPGYSDIFWPPPKWLFPEQDGEDITTHKDEEDTPRMGGRTDVAKRSKANRCPK